MKKVWSAVNSKWDRTRAFDNNGSLLPNKARTNGHYSSSNNNSAFKALLDEMASLGFRPFQMSVLLWMGAKGFDSIRPLGRYHRRGRGGQGGADFLAKLPGSQLDVAVQIRHWKTPVQRRAVDELWGFMLRNDVPMGMVVTNSSFMKSAIESIWEFPGRPIQLVSREDFCSSMVSLELGFCKQNSRWALDESFFRSLNLLTLAPALERPLAHRICSRSTGSRNSEFGLEDEVKVGKSKRIKSKLWTLVVIVLLALGILLWFGALR